mmetsp:Transcript_9170/g.13270  ORF Transcript_9170/g.13270 Transcript_9170/m.13270 type:complete len:225 (-) Transcript_9170:482-1156(-)
MISMMQTFLFLAFLVSAIGWTSSLFTRAINEIGESIKPARVTTDKNISVPPPSFYESMGQGNSPRLLKVRRTPPESETLHDSPVYFQEQIIGNSFGSATVVSPANKSTATILRPTPVVANPAPIIKPFAPYKPPSPVANPTTPVNKPVSPAAMARNPDVRPTASIIKPSAPVAPTSPVAKPTLPGASGPARIFVVRPMVAAVNGSTPSVALTFPVPQTMARRMP